MSHLKMGWKDTNEEGTRSPFDSKGPRRFWMPAGVKTTLLFLDDEPTSQWEHNFRMNGRWGNFEPCLKKAGGDRCPICDSGDKVWPYFVGFFTAINMTPWFSKKDGREINYQRQVFAARMGSEAKPGILKKLDRLRQSEGRLRGCVYEVYRSGTKTESCGDDFRLIEKIDLGEIEKYGRDVLAKYCERLNEKMPAKDHLTVDKLWERHPWRPFNFEKLFNTDWKQRPIGELDRLFSTGGPAALHTSSEDDRSGGTGQDDDICPY